MLDVLNTSTLAMGESQWFALCMVGIVAIVAGVVRSVLVNGAKERSRREIAAYIAEGSMSPEQGERLMAAGNPKDDCA